MTLDLPLIGSAHVVNEPVTGVDVIVRSKADGSVMVETLTDGRGAFDIVVREKARGPTR